MIYIGLLMLIAIIACITRNGKLAYGRLVLCSLSFILLLLIMGLRAVRYAGVDVLVYARDFQRIVNQNYSILEIFRYFYKDYGFYIGATIFSKILPNVNAWIFLSAVPYLLVIIIIIYKYSENVFMSLIIFICYDYYIYNFQLMRHVSMLAFILLAFISLQKDNDILFVLFTILASTMHVTGILFLLAWPLKRVTINRKQLVWLFCGILVISIFGQPKFLSVFLNLFPDFFKLRFLHFAYRSGTTANYFIISMLLVIICWMFLYYVDRSDHSLIELKLKKQEKAKSIWKIRIPANSKYIVARFDFGLAFNLSIVGTILYLGQIYVAEAYRLAQMFSIFLVVLVPFALSGYKNRVIKSIISFLIVIYGIRRLTGGVFLENSVYNPYIAFWQ